MTIFSNLISQSAIKASIVASYMDLVIQMVQLIIYSHGYCFLAKKCLKIFSQDPVYIREILIFSHEWIKKILPDCRDKHEKTCMVACTTWGNGDFNYQPFNGECLYTNFSHAIVFCIFPCLSKIDCHCSLACNICIGYNVDLFFNPLKVLNKFTTFNRQVNFIVLTPSLKNVGNFNS